MSNERYSSKKISDNVNQFTTKSKLDEKSTEVSECGDEEMERLQKTFSKMIDETCSGSNENIFENSHNTTDTIAFLFRSMIPLQEILQQELECESQQNLFKYEEESTKYTFKVLDRRTNQLTDEYAPIYQKCAMRLLFKGLVQRELLSTNTVRNLLARETIRLGEAFDEPKSRKHIPSFIKMYKIDLDELLEPNISRYFSFNEFFYRKLKPNARPIDNPNDSCTIVSAADCRLILFENISDATRIWIKGQNFSLKHLFDDDLLAQEFDGGSIAVFRLSPADYHRFHSPVTGSIGESMKTIPGTFYTVNPIAIRESLDVLTENQRKLITIESSCFGKVAFVAIGALLVGSINFTVKKNQSVEKGDEVGKKKTLVQLLCLIY